MNFQLIFWFLGALILSFVGSRLVMALARRFDIVDRPTNDSRKIHQKSMPLLGGLAIYVSVAVFTLLLIWLNPIMTSGEIGFRQYVGFLFGGFILMVGGFLDDRYDLPPRLAIIAPLLASAAAVAFGIEVSKLTNPFSAIGGSAFGGGGVIELASWQSSILVFVWLIIMTFTTKFLDGIDGLATGVSSVGALMILLLSLTTAYFQPDVAHLSVVVLGALLGFLAWNFHPASIFLGEGGSTFVGYTIGVLAVISGGKLAIALLALGIPLLDAAWVILRRSMRNGLRSTVRHDNRHLHHRLLDLGWSQSRVVFAYVFVATLFGLAGLFLQSRDKLLALGVLIIFMIVSAFFLVFKKRYANPS